MDLQLPGDLDVGHWVERWDRMQERYNVRRDERLSTVVDLAAYREQILGEWEGIEEGLPLEWHFERLRAVGFGEVDCFWRFGGDAVYGGALR